MQIKVITEFCCQTEEEMKTKTRKQNRCQQIQFGKRVGRKPFTPLTYEMYSQVAIITALTPYGMGAQMHYLEGLRLTRKPGRFNHKGIRQLGARDCLAHTTHLINRRDFLQKASGAARNVAVLWSHHDPRNITSPSKRLQDAFFPKAKDRRMGAHVIPVVPDNNLRCLWYFQRHVG
jgi:hypothetical protein